MKGIGGPIVLVSCLLHLDQALEFSCIRNNHFFEFAIPFSRLSETKLQAPRPQIAGGKVITLDGEVGMMIGPAGVAFKRIIAEGKKESANRGRSWKTFSST